MYSKLYTTSQKFLNSKRFNFFVKNSLLLTKPIVKYFYYKPDSKKVGTLYKLWIKQNAMMWKFQISIFYSEYNIDDLSNV